KSYKKATRKSGFFISQSQSDDKMAVNTLLPYDWLSLLTNSSLIPASAFVAICLFILRELLDGCRKAKARKHEIRALKQIFARECQLAWFMLRPSAG
ncbi:TPA: hypothetical protein ACIPVM_004717, partial [Salmonella enterica subsp. diarizonae serovar 50:k:z35]